MSILFPLGTATEKGSWRVNSVPWARNLLLQMITQTGHTFRFFSFFHLRLCKHRTNGRNQICRQTRHWGSSFPHSLCQCVTTLLPRGHLSGDSTSASLLCQSCIYLTSLGSWLQAHQTLPEWWFRNWTDTAKWLCMDHLLRTATRTLAVSVQFSYLGQTQSTDLRRSSKSLAGYISCCLLGTTLSMLSNLNILIAKTFSRHSTVAKYFCCVVFHNSEQHHTAEKLLSKLWKSVCLTTSTIAGLNC